MMLTPSYHRPVLVRCYHRSFVLNIPKQLALIQYIHGLLAQRSTRDCTAHPAFISALPSRRQDVAGIPGCACSSKTEIRHQMMRERQEWMIMELS